MGDIEEAQAQRDFARREMDQAWSAWLVKADAYRMAQERLARLLPPEPPDPPCLLDDPVEFAAEHGSRAIGASCQGCGRSEATDGIAVSTRGDGRRTCDRCRP